VTKKTRGHSAPVFYPRFVLLCAIVFSLSGCALFCSVDPHKQYSTVRVTDIEGRLVAEWVAEGCVLRIENGYKFKAVERVSGPPFPQVMRYPLGRHMEISGPNIVVTRCGKPLWLYHLEGQ